MQLTLFVNHRCNLRCTYCYTGRKFQRPMPLSVAHKAVDFGFSQADQGFLVLTFFGGEPMLELELMQAAVAYTEQRGEALDKKVFPAVATNGTLLDRPRLALLHDHDFQVQVSLDGCPEAQAATRRFRNGRSSSARVEKNLLRLLSEGFKPRIVAVVDPKNAHLIDQSFEYLMDLGVDYIHFSPNYSGAWDDAACDAFEAALARLGDRFADRLRAGQDVRLDPLNGKIVTHLNRGYKPENRCQFGVKEVAVGPSGRLYPCDRLVCEDTGGEICIGDVDSGLDRVKRDRLVAAKNDPDNECVHCELRPRCMFWCGCANYETTGNVGKVSPEICWFERCFIEQADRVASTLFAEKDPAFLRRFYIPELHPPLPETAQ